MKNILKLFLSFFATLFSSMSALAQQADEVEMADVMRSSGKIYVVVAVLLIILIGLIIFLIRIDRKVSQLEKKNRENS
jgi:uncharacterized membrane protein